MGPRVKVEVDDGHPEVVLRRGLYAVRAVAEVRRVEVPREDLVLRQLSLETYGERCLLHLAQHRALLVRVDLLDVLLRDRRPTLDVRPGQVLPCRAADREWVDAAVLEKRAVLGGDDRVAHHLRDVLGRHLFALVRRTDGCEHLAGRVEQQRRLGRRRGGEVDRRGQQPTGERPEATDNGENHPEHRHPPAPAPAEPRLPPTGRVPRPGRRRRTGNLPAQAAAALAAHHRRVRTPRGQGEVPGPLARHRRARAGAFAQPAPGPRRPPTMSPASTPRADPPMSLPRRARHGQG